jgi:hypothetical protein
LEEWIAPAIRAVRSVLAADADIVAKRPTGSADDDAGTDIAIERGRADPARRTADGRAFKVGCNATRQDENADEKRGERGALVFAHMSCLLLSMGLVTRKIDRFVPAR